MRGRPDMFASPSQKPFPLAEEPGPSIAKRSGTNLLISDGSQCTTRPTLLSAWWSPGSVGNRPRPLQTCRGLDRVMAEGCWLIYGARFQLVAPGRTAGPGAWESLSNAFRSAHHIVCYSEGETRLTVVKKPSPLCEVYRRRYTSARCSIVKRDTHWSSSIREMIRTSITRNGTRSPSLSPRASRTDFGVRTGWSTGKSGKSMIDPNAPISSPPFRTDLLPGPGGRNDLARHRIPQAAHRIRGGFSWSASCSPSSQ